MGAYLEKFPAVILLSIFLSFGVAASVAAKKGGGGEPPGDFNPEIVWVYSNDIIIANGDGSNPTTIFSSGNGPSAGNIWVVSWSPDGNEILFFWGEGKHGPGGVYRLPIFDSDRRDGGNISVGAPSLVVSSDALWGGAQWSPVRAPDGNYWIAYSHGSDIFLINPDSEAPSPIPLTNIVPENETLIGFTWSHDATRIAVMIQTEPAEGPNGDGRDVPEDIVIYSLSVDGGNLVVEEPPVSLLLSNPHIDFEGVSNAAKLANSNTNFDHLDWANGNDWIAVNTSTDGTVAGLKINQIWIVPVPIESTQQAVAEDTFLAMDDDASRLWVNWSPDDTSLLYRRSGAGGDCPIETDQKGKFKITSNLVIGVLNNPDEIECNGETILNSTGNAPEWWRGDGFTPPVP